VLDLKGRDRVSRVVAPIAWLLSRTPVTPTYITLAGLAITMGGAFLLAIGQLVAGALVAGFGSVLDMLDGPLARLTGTDSKRGAFLDTISDRVGEAAVWTGIAFFAWDDRTAVTLCVTGLAVSMLVPYVRAKAEVWHVDARGGIMGRAERLLVLLTGVGLNGFGFGFDLLLPTLWLMTVLTGITVLVRTYRTWGRLTE